MRVPDGSWPSNAAAAGRGARWNGPDEREDFAERAVRSAGARMIQTAYESLAMLQQLTPQMILLLQVSLNVLTRPQQARRELFALS